MRLTTLIPTSRAFLVTDPGLPEPANPFERARALRIEAARCFRLALGSSSMELADELEALGRAFETEAEQLAA
jgi:hypothetical protein